MPKTKTVKKAVKSAPKKETKTDAAKASSGIFAKIQEKTGADDKKIDAWQTKWLAMPETRKKYEKITDAPEVVGEELFAMTNDIIDFLQKEEGGKSVLFKKIKECADEFKKDPYGYMKDKAVKGKTFAFTAKSYIEEKARIAKEMWNMAKERVEKAKQVSDKKPGAKTEKPKKTAKKPTKKLTS